MLPGAASSDAILYVVCGAGKERSKARKRLLQRESEREEMDQRRGDVAMLLQACMQAGKARLKQGRSLLACKGKVAAR